MEKQYGWFKSLSIIAMCFTELSGKVNSLCLNLSVGRISISRLFSYCIEGSISVILVDLSLNNRADV